MFLYGAVNLISQTCTKLPFGAIVRKEESGDSGLNMRTEYEDIPLNITVHIQKHKDIFCNFVDCFSTDYSRSEFTAVNNIGTAVPDIFPQFFEFRFSTASDVVYVTHQQQCFFLGHLWDDLPAYDICCRSVGIEYVCKNIIVISPDVSVYCFIGCIVCAFVINV